MTICVVSFPFHHCLTGLCSDEGMLNKECPIRMIMIILKLNINKINISDLDAIGKIELKDLGIIKRDFLGEFKEENLKLIKDVQQYLYNENNNNIILESIIGECMLPVFLDNEDKQKRSTFVEIKREELEIYIRELQNEIDKLKKEKEQEQNPELKRELSVWIEDLEIWRDKLKKLLGQKTILLEKKYTRLGYYTRNGKSHNPEIVLLMGVIGDNKQRLISTYIHEMFHAYYDWEWLKDQTNPNFIKKEKDLGKYIEEPLTEYAMLKFLDKFGYNDILEVAKIVGKKQLSPGTCHYGFGYYLWKWEKDGHDPLCDWIKCYKEAKFEIRDTKDKSKFEYPFSKGLYPFGKEYESMELLCEILTGDKCEQQDSNVSTGGRIQNKRKKSRLFGQYL